MSTRIIIENFDLYPHEKPTNHGISSGYGSPLQFSSQTAQPHFHQPLGGHRSASQQRCSGKSDASWPLKQSSRGAAWQAQACFFQCIIQEIEENTMEKPWKHHEKWWLYINLKRLGGAWIASLSEISPHTIFYSRLAAPLHMLTDKI